MPRTISGRHARLARDVSNKRRRWGHLGRTGTLEHTLVGTRASSNWHILRMQSRRKNQRDPCPSGCVRPSLVRAARQFWRAQLGDSPICPPRFRSSRSAGYWLAFLGLVALLAAARASLMGRIDVDGRGRGHAHRASAGARLRRRLSTAPAPAVTVPGISVRSNERWRGIPPASMRSAG